MNREEASALLKAYKQFPRSNLFSIKPYNYPIFYLLECFAKGWTIERYSWSDDGGGYCEDVDFEWLIKTNKIIGRDFTWQFVARNPDLLGKPTQLAYVQEDLFSRYIGRCNPLKGPNTSWSYIPKKCVSYDDDFRGKIGSNTKLYLLEVDLSLVDVIGTFNPKVPWHYLQQTIDWKPYVGELNFNGI